MRTLLARAVFAMVAVAALSALTPAPSALAAAPFSRLDPSTTRLLRATAALRPGDGATLLAVDDAAVRAFRSGRGGHLSIPDGTAGGDGSFELDLEPYDLFTPGAGPTYTDDRGVHPFAPDVSLFRGHVTGDARSWVVMAMSGAGVIGVVEQGGRRWSLAPVQRMASGPMAAAAGVHALAPEGALTEEISRFECGINADNEARYTSPRPRSEGLGQGFGIVPMESQFNAIRLSFAVAVDCDYEIYAQKFSGNLTAATAYVLTVLGTVNLIYERDVEATLGFPYLNFWTTAADPYNAGTTSGALSEVQSYWQANMGGVSRNTVHLLSGKPLGGGIAFIDGMCGGNGYGVSAIDCAYAYPTVTTTWDVMVVAHELGHNSGSFHTHSCMWISQGFLASGTLDSCQATESGACATYTNHLPPNKGTIMSYCHLIGGVAGGIRLEFHPVCVSRMRQIMASCSGPPVPSPPRNPLATSIATGVRLTWTASSSPGVLRYSVVRSRLPIDLTAGYLGHTTASPFDTPGLGVYYYRMRTVRAADSSSFSGEVKGTACAFVSAAPVLVGSFPTAAVPEDLNEDGIQDVALVTTVGGNLVVLLGQGAGGVGNGNFAAPVSVPTGPGPACMALLDANGDGILDAVVGAQDDNSLVLHLGQGAGGVGDGTFGAASLLASLDFPPTGIATADFDEDGLLDLAVAGGTSSLVVLAGQGAAGVPNGTFAAPVTVSVGSPTRGVLAYDWNGDGITDLATTGSGARVLFGNGSSGKGDGTFTVGPLNTVGTTPNHMTTGDFNADGIADLVVSNTGGSSVSVLLGNGSGGVPDGTFTPAAGAASGSGPNAVAVGDWNFDGKPDLAVACNNASNSTSVMLGLGDGAFEAAQTFATGGGNPAFIAVNDFNEDGTPDFLACNRLSQSVTRQLAGCTPTLSHALQITSPNGSEIWTGGEEHTVTWSKGPGVLTVDLQRSDDGGVNWRTLACGLIGTSYSYTVTSPWTVNARMRVVESHAAQFADASDTPFEVQEPIQLGVEDGVPALALLGAWPNPARADLTISLSLAVSGAPGSLELLDLAGRRVAAVDLGGRAAGRTQIRLLDGQAVRPGLYVVRLTHAGAVRAMKVAVLR